MNTAGKSADFYGVRSHGAYALARLALPQRRLAEVAGVTQNAVRKWIFGESKPGLEARERMQAKYGIHPTWWDEPYDPHHHGAAPVVAPGERLRPISVPKKAPIYSAEVAPAPPPPRLPPAPPPPLSTEPIPPGVFGKADMLERMLNELMNQAASDPMATPNERAVMLSRCSATLKNLAVLRGQWELGTRLFRLPVWLEIKVAMGRAVAGFPEAADRIGKALRGVEARHLGYGESPASIPDGADYFTKDREDQNA